MNDARGGQLEERPAEPKLGEQDRCLLQGPVNGYFQCVLKTETNHKQENKL